MEFRRVAVIAALLTGACGSADRRPDLAECPADCPAELCNPTTGVCERPEPPDTLIATRPAALSSSREASFTFTSPQAGATFTCRLDGVAVACGPMVTFTVADGTHTLEVTAVLDGRADPTPVVYTWTVDAGAPTVRITAPTADAVLSPRVSFAFEADETVTYACTLDEVALADCAPGMTQDDLPSGPHTFGVTGTDAAGNLSAPASVTFRVNRAPSLGAIAAITTPEDVATAPIAFSVADADTPLGNLTVTVASTDDTLLPPGRLTVGGANGNRTLVLRGGDNRSGSATLTVTVSDGFAQTSAAVDVTITAVNDPPTISNVGNQTVAEDGTTAPIAFVIGDVETPAGNLTVTRASSNLTVLPLAGITLGGAGANRTVVLKPAANQTGPVTVTLTVSDGVASASDTFVLTVGSNDDPPTITPTADQTTPEDTARTVQVTVADLDTPLGNVTVTGQSLTPGLIQAINVTGTGATRTVTITPVANATGTATIELTAADQTSSVSDTFQLQITAVNDNPVITAPGTQTINEDSSTGAVAFTVTDVDSAAITMTASSGNPTVIPNANIVLGGSGSNRTVTVTPAANQNSAGVAITLNASDGAGGSSAKTFTVVVTPVNDAPSITPPGAQTIAEDTPGTFGFTVSDIDTPLANLTVTGSGPGATIASVTTAGTAGSRTVTVTPIANVSSATAVPINLRVSDGSLASNGQFGVTITPVNDPPGISNLGDLDLDPDQPSGPISFTVGDADSDAVTVTASSSDTRVVPAANLALGGSGTSRTVSITPGASQGGATTITLTAADPTGLTATDTFLVRVRVQVASTTTGPGVVRVVAGCPGTASFCNLFPGAGTVTFEADPDPGAVFVGWSGACDGAALQASVSPIPTSTATCHATFRGLWARSFSAPVTVSSRGLAVTGDLVRVLGTESSDGSAMVIWSASGTNGAPSNGRRFFGGQGLPLIPVDVVANPNAAGGVVVLARDQGFNTSMLLFLDGANNRTASFIYPQSGLTTSPTQLVATPGGGFAFIDAAVSAPSDTASVTFGRLVRTDGQGAALGQTVFLDRDPGIEGGCANRNTTPFSFAVSPAGNFLVASYLQAAPGQGLHLDLSYYDSAGVFQWARRVTPTRASDSFLPYGVIALGEEFVVTGATQEEAGTSLDSFAMRFKANGDLAWARRAGRPGLNDVGARAVAAPGGFVMTGWSVRGAELKSDLFATKWTGTGDTITTGFEYGGAGTETGLVIQPASGVGFFLFGSTSASFGNTDNDAWGLQVDNDLAVKFNGSGAVRLTYKPIPSVLRPLVTNPTCFIQGASAASRESVGATGTEIPIESALQAP